MLFIFNLKNRLSIPTQYKILDRIERFRKSLQHIEIIVAPIMLINNHDYSFHIASQNMSILGRSIGELSPQHLKYYHINYTFIGHLERQVKLNESYDIINSKLNNALFNNLIPIVCIGKSDNMINELENIIQTIDLSQKEVIIAYEVLSATLSSTTTYKFEDIKENYMKLQDYLQQLSKNFYHFKYRVVFGGNVTQNNLYDILNIGFDGILVGDRQEEIYTIINNVRRKIYV